MVACTTCVSPSGVRVFLTVVERCIEGLQTIPLTPHHSCRISCGHLKVDGTLARRLHRFVRDRLICVADTRNFLGKPGAWIHAMPVDRNTLLNPNLAWKVPVQRHVWIRRHIYGAG